MLGGYGEFLYQTGMIDELQKQYVDQQTDHGVKLIQQEKWVEAFEVMSWCCSSSTFAVFSNCWRHTCHGCLFHFNFNRLTSGLWSFAEWRCRSLSLLLPKCNRLYQLLQLLDMSGTRSSLKFFFCKLLLFNSLKNSQISFVFLRSLRIRTTSPSLWPCLKCDVPSTWATWRSTMALRWRSTSCRMSWRPSNHGWGCWWTTTG